MNTVVYHTGALGDFITILPCLRLLRQQRPAARWILLGRPEHGRLGVAAGYFDEYVDAGGRAMSALYEGRLPDELKRFGHLSAVAFAADDSPVLVALRSVAELLLHHAPFPAACEHIIDYHLRLPGADALAAEGRCPRIAVAPQSGEWRGAVVLHPGSGSPAKNWPLERFAWLAGQLAASGRTVAWLLGPVERETGLRLPGGSRVLPPMELVELAGVLSGAALCTGNDSGVAHLAAACRCPTVAVFGPSDPRVWAPRGPRVEIVAASNSTIESVGPGRVLDACRRAMG
jgi:heptosyltransferase III